MKRRKTIEKLERRSVALRGRYLMEKVICRLRVKLKKYTLSGASFEYVMGIKNGCESIEFQGDVDISDLKDAIIGDKLQISMADLEEQLEELQDADELFIARFSLVVIGTILCPPSWVHLSSSYLYALFYLDHVHWQGDLVDRTISLIDFWDYQKCSRVMKWIRSVGGFSRPKVLILNLRDVDVKGILVV
ncbi:hypothetical protein PanWU01x14_266300 [Parasponia andersonii]|uniref:Uncharacterized protein n=1 Tax=Parasponia andersonii TaxID=3476 RepID=A0A2P5B6W7_PARAD|nr:hypothetical protein PanWU01x14_266300 [Parasponia andersonii]